MPRKASQHTPKAICGMGRACHGRDAFGPLCFNLFGELAVDHGLATALARCLWGDHVHRVTSVRFESLLSHKLGRKIEA